MSATKLAVKRKISDESPTESNGASKKRKVVEKQIANKESAKESDSSVVFSSEDNIDARKVRQKLSSILHYEKKYKYYCKKHNVLYLVENARRRSRELSKKSRDILVNSFRSLDITKDFSVEEQLLADPQQFLLNTKDEYSDDQKNVLNQLTSDSTMTESKISRIFVTFDEDEIDALTNRAQCNRHTSANKKTTNELTISQIVHRFILCDESEDSDFDEGFKEDYHENSKNEDYILTRSPKGKNIIMKRVTGSNDRNEYEDCCTSRCCLHNYNFKSYLSDYDSSFDDSFDGLYTG